MNKELKEKIKISLQKLLPFFLSLFFIFVNYMPSNIGIGTILRPDVGVICVFYWVLYRSDLFNMFMVFFLGLIGDLLSLAPFGADVITYLTVYVITSNMMTFFYNKPFIVVWYGFSFVFIIAEFVKWFIVSVYYAEFLPVSGLLFTILFTIACYPLFSLLNDLAQKFLMSEED